MIVAEELDVGWGDVIVEQANLNTKYFTRQFIGGSQAIRSGYTNLRTAGATARAMLIAAAAQSWQVPAHEITVKASTISHKGTGKSANFGEFASLAPTMPVPREVQLKNSGDFGIIGTSRKNVESIETYFVDNGEAPSGLGEPAYPPVFAALANALYKATGKRFYDQPFINHLNV